MLDKVEFSDLYKFLTSIGLIVFVSAFIIPWLFTKEDMGLLITESNYQNLTESSKSLADNRISYNQFILNVIPYVSCALLFIGAFIIGYGIYHWKRKQKFVDETEELRLVELRSQIKSLKPEEIDQKAYKEVKADIREGDIKPEVNTSSEKSEPTIEHLKTNLIDMEKLFYQKILDYNSFEYEVKPNVKLNDRFQIDILLSSFNVKKNPDCFIEIKYLQINLSMKAVKDAFADAQKVYIHYYTTTKRKAKLVLIIVYSESIASKEEIDRFRSAVVDYNNRINSKDYQILVMSDIEAHKFNITEIIK